MVRFHGDHGGGYGATISLLDMANHGWLPLSGGVDRQVVGWFPIHFKCQ
jgi:hypothetical protein